MAILQEELGANLAPGMARGGGEVYVLPFSPGKATLLHSQFPGPQNLLAWLFLLALCWVPFVGLLGLELLLAWELKDKCRWKSPPGTTLLKCQSKYKRRHEMQWRLLATAISTLLVLCYLLMACHQHLSKPP